jgi:hypothetical protein
MIASCRSPAARQLRWRQALGDRGTALPGRSSLRWPSVLLFLMLGSAEMAVSCS